MEKFKDSYHNRKWIHFLHIIPFRRLVSFLSIVAWLHTFGFAATVFPHFSSKDRFGNVFYKRAFLAAIVDAPFLRTFYALQYTFWELLERLYECCDPSLVA